jgi:hypothetical protein
MAVKRDLTTAECAAVADKAAYAAGIVNAAAPRMAAYVKLEGGLVVRVQVHLTTVDELNELASKAVANMDLS